MSRKINRQDSHRIFDSMVRHAKKKGFAIEKSPYIGPAGPNDDPDAEQLGRNYPGEKVMIVDGMSKRRQELTWLHEMGHELGLRNEGTTEDLARRIHRSLTAEQRHRMRRFIPPDTDIIS